MELTERRRKILSSIVNDYIKYGEPVGSKAIAEDVGVSSATIRNEMATLIQLGLLEQPHTSSGRIPTNRGYREYVDSLESEMPSKHDKSFFDSILSENSYDSEHLLICVPKLLAAYSKYISLVSAPGAGGSRVKAVQFVQISRRSAMLILMSSAGTVKNRIFQCDYDLTSEITRLFFRVFNEKLRGMRISDITIAFIQSTAVSLGELSMLSASPLMALLEVARETAKSEMLVFGQMNLLFYPELEYQTVREILNFLDDKSTVGRLLNSQQKNPAVLIGDETGRRELKDASVAMSKYQINRQENGCIAVIGPIRMNYQRTLSALRYLSLHVSETLKALTQDE